MTCVGCADVRWHWRLINALLCFYAFIEAYQRRFGDHLHGNIGFNPQSSIAKQSTLRLEAWKLHSVNNCWCLLIAEYGNEKWSFRNKNGNFYVPTSIYALRVAVQCSPSEWQGKIISERHEAIETRCHYRISPAQFVANPSGMCYKLYHPMHTGLWWTICWHHIFSPELKCVHVRSVAASSLEQTTLK